MIMCHQVHCDRGQNIAGVILADAFHINSFSSSFKLFWRLDTFYFMSLIMWDTSLELMNVLSADQSICYLTPQSHSPKQEEQNGQGPCLVITTYLKFSHALVLAQIIGITLPNNLDCPLCHHMNMVKKHVLLRELRI
jgi:hypothetical protein